MNRVSKIDRQLDNGLMQTDQGIERKTKIRNKKGVDGCTELDNGWKN